MYDARFSIGSQSTELQNINDVPSEGIVRWESRCLYINRLFDGGIIPGFTFTLSGEAGTGKTTLAYHILEEYSATGFKCGYASNEESITQLKNKALRLQMDKFRIAHTPILADILEMMEELDIIVIDSLQGILIPGETKQVEKKALNAIVAYAKEYSCSVILVTHATKAGQEKGDSSVGHIVDGRIIIKHGLSEAFLMSGPRIVDILKHRESETGSMVFEMTALGLDINNPFFNGLKEISAKAYKKR